MRTLSRLAVTVLALGALASGPAFAANINPPRGSSPPPAVEPGPSVPPAVPSAPEPAAETPLFEQVRPLTAAVLKDKFRDDYDSLVDQFAEIAETSGTDDERQQRGAEAVMLVAQKYAEDLQKAPLATTRDIVERFVALHEDVLAKAGAETCAEFSFDGSMVLYRTGKSADYIEALDELGSVFFEGAATARVTPTSVEEALTADWAALSTALKDSGAPDSYFDSMAKQDTKDPELCPAMIAMMKQMVTFAGEAGDRLRGSLAKSAAVY